MTNLERLRAGMEGEGPRSGWRETVGARIASVEKGQGVVELETHAGHRHEGGVVQGGIIAQIADAAMAISLMTLQAPGESNATIELKINYIRPVVEGLIRATGRVIEMKRSLLFAEADVTDAEGRLVARASSTCMAIAARRDWRQ